MLLFGVCPKNRPILPELISTKVTNYVKNVQTVWLMKMMSISVDLVTPVAITAFKMSHKKKKY